jgi:general secretion pathway protein G
MTLSQIRKKLLERASLPTKPANNSSGFTLIEMMIVMAIIALIAGFVGTKVMRRFDESKVSATKIQIKQIGVILDDFRRVCGFYPTTEQGLDALAKAPTSGRLCKNYDPEGFIKRVPQDAWSRDFVYVSDGNKYNIKSLGADGKEGGEGFDKDISSDDID